MEAWLLAVALWLQAYAGGMLPAELAPEADPRLRPAVRVSVCERPSW